MSSPPLLPPPTDHPAELARQALALAARNPDQAHELLGEAARRATQQGMSRQAALILHRRAALTLQQGGSPMSDLAMAARLLEGEERALVLLDLGQALLRGQDLRRASLVLRESEALARRAGNVELATAARHALGQVASEMGDHAGARTFLRETGQMMAQQLEQELLATLRDMGNLPHDPFAEQERARRQAAIEEELAALKRQLGL